jgi:hexosaminidase
MDTRREISIIPEPRRLRRLTGEFLLTPRTRILTEPENEALSDIGARLADKLNRTTGFKIVSDTSSQTQTPDGSIFLTTRTDEVFESPEEYTLEVLPRGVTILASTAHGISHAVQTLRQLLPPGIEGDRPVDRPELWTIPAVRIHDAPRFEWRGMLLDSCRHFAGKHFVLKTLDLLAYHKLNRFHWHLTDDQGWRIEIRSRPRLTEIGAYRTDRNGRRYGGFYTRDDVREIVKYASDRGIVVIPEIDMPGHSVAALASYPDLSCTGKSIPVATEWGIFDDIMCAGSERVFEFVSDVLTEVADLFPGPWVHVGGDEVPVTQWETCTRCRERMDNESLEVDDLRCYFFNRVARILESLGRQPIGWDEVLCDDLTPSAILQVWRKRYHAATAARLGHKVVVSPTSHVYFDYDTDKTDLAKVYSFDPVPDGLPPAATRRILGSECAMWTEHAPRDRIESMLYPRIVAFAERLWSPARRADFNDFRRRLDVHEKRLELMGVDFRR